MLPPQLRQGVRPRSLSAPALPARPASLHPARTHFGWRRPKDYTSPLDPSYDRFHRIRNIKNRAKLLSRLRRRGKFDWDTNELNPFFAPRHVRWASHWDWRGKNRGERWVLSEDGGKNDGKNGEKGEPVKGESGHELSSREKAWKEQMEAMRKRIDKDPYEAVFGRRFEPFWSPLVPSWMREEMGLQNWPKQSKTQPSQVEPKAAEKASKKVESVAEKTKPATKKGAQSRKPDSYSYASSSSWDSRTNKATRTEWDSVSEKQRRYEYDPVSNRMVEVEALAQVKSAPVKEPQPSRKATPIPQFQSSVEDIPQVVALASKPAQTQPAPPLPSRPSALAKLPKTDLEMLTADDLRASMGKTKFSDRAPALSEQEKASLEGAFDADSSAHDAETDSILRSRRQPSTQWDQAETLQLLEQELATLREKRNKLDGDERGLFHIERLKQEMRKLDARTRQVLKRIDGVASTTDSQGRRKIAHDQRLQPALSRLASKPLPTRDELEDPEDAAAHESTEPWHPQSLPNIPANWPQQADLLQADRVRRTAGKDPFLPSHDASSAAANAQSTSGAPPAPPNNDDTSQKYRTKLTASRADLAQAYKRSAIHAEKHVERIRFLEAQLAARSPESTDAGERQKYRAKLAALRAEVDTAYARSAVHSEKHVERIRALEAELAAARSSATESPSQSTAAAASAAAAPPSAEPDEASLQAEGDVSASVARFASSDKWYKRTATAPFPTPSAAAVARAAKAVRAHEQGERVRAAYRRGEGGVGPGEAGAGAVVGTAAAGPKAGRLGDALGAYGIEDYGGGEGDGKTVVPRDGDALAAYEASDYEARKPYRFREDGLSEEIAAKGRGEVEEGLETKAYCANEGTGKYEFKDDGLRKRIEALEEKVEMDGVETKAYCENEKPERYSFKDDGLRKRIEALEEKMNVDGVETLAYCENETPEKYAFREDGLRKRIEALEQKQEQDGVETQAYCENETPEKYSFKEDGLRKRLEALQKTEEPDGVEAQLYCENEKPDKYAFREDGLRGRMQTQGKAEPEDAETLAYSKNERSSRYAFQEDGLERRIEDQAAPERDGAETLAYRENERADWYRYQKDGFEGGFEELAKAEREGVETEAYRENEGPQKYEFRDDGLGNRILSQAREDPEDYETRAYRENELPQSYQYRDNGFVEKPEPLEQSEGVETRAYHENEAPEAYRFQDDGLASQLRQDANESKLVNDQAPKLIPTSLDKPAAECSKSYSTVSWQEPPLYKILAYDSGNDRMTTATTTSNFVGIDGDRPIAIPQALENLYQPARFVEVLSGLQHEGWALVFGGRDMVVFRKMQPTTAETSNDTSAASPGLEDFGLFSNRDQPVNPVDGTGRPAADEQTKTGSYASPTGFVNHDPVESADAKPSPAIHREEAHFTGTLPGRSPRKQDGTEGAAAAALSKGQQRRTAENRQHFSKSDTSQGSYAGIALGWTAVLGGGAYLAGCFEERSRKSAEQEGLERWERLVQMGKSSNGKAPRSAKDREG